ncbi:MAG: hypothetical protein HY795_01030 [Desulfovibrio sp.]|nr:hypothetical protein [Desulfovibrio sp.]
MYVQEPPRPLDPAETLTPYLETTIYRLDRTQDGIGVVSFKAGHEKPLWRHVQSAP